MNSEPSDSKAQTAAPTKPGDLKQSDFVPVDTKASGKKQINISRGCFSVALAVLAGLGYFYVRIFTPSCPPSLLVLLVPLFGFLAIMSAFGSWVRKEGPVAGSIGFILGLVVLMFWFEVCDLGNW